MFCYIAYLSNREIKIDTFGNLHGSQKAVDTLNQEYGPHIKFYLSDSMQTLSDFRPSYQIDFAWVDGGHSFEVCTTDLVNCARLNISSIAVDDYKWKDSIKKAVDRFIIKYNYEITNISNFIDYRGIAYLEKRN